VLRCENVLTVIDTSYFIWHIRIVRSGLFIRALQSCTVEMSLICNAWKPQLLLILSMNKLVLQEIILLVHIIITCFHANII
jgi:hypothetical protein